ncbi:ATP-binding protein [Profundibacterium mesophilum]|uniref:Chaperone protein HtpG n=1 Tax=Profundibacterium mesophilum KAUST100406-0324 TaxID=1037889 RepID=A0A921NTF5_9RHOB|nr:ATP-binding protein [Profundibacterium mesophilum]KAF0676279.1 Chaperone protein HtpG [Profundibacterium mesophilum KAUST100406-0324]
MFENFDPLKIHDTAAVDESVVSRRHKRSIHSILHSYVGWYDPFAELIQNAIDSVEKRSRVKEHKKKVRILIDEAASQLTVSDNGIGLDQASFQKFLAPHESFKEAGERGSKGVGATFLAYGFNYIRIDTKTKHFTANGEMEGARIWLHDANASANPEVFPTDEDHIDDAFKEFDQGASITLRFDKTTKPSKLSWPGLKSAEPWFVALSVKTAIGAVSEKTNLAIVVKHIDQNGSVSQHDATQTGYMLPHAHFAKTGEYGNVVEKISENVEKKGAAAKLPISIRNLDAVWLNWSQSDILENVEKLSADEIDGIKKHELRILASFMSGAKVWRRLADSKIGYRPTANIYGPGIQMAADNMPQGEMIQVPLDRYIGRQNQVHFVVHFKNCVVDLGRKGFDRDLVDLAKSVSKKIVERNFTKIRDCLRNEDVKKKEILQGDKVDSWKKILENHEKTSPLSLENSNFFIPVNEISISSEPSREQDVVALFNQLIAGGVVRGLKVVGTNEMSTYDGAYRVRIGPSFEDHVFDDLKNPLGISDEVAGDYEDEHPDGFLSSKLYVLEYKFSLDGLISDITTGEKKAADIDLVVAWEAGKDYRKYFSLSSLLNSRGMEDRSFHGVTHVLADEHGNNVMDVVLLKDLIGYLNDPEDEVDRQKVYDED